jgi:hypothetical protein
MRRPGRAVALLLVLAALTACGTKAAEPAEPSGQPGLIEPTPSADGFIAAVMRTRGLGTAEATFDVTTTVGDTTRDLTGSGAIGLPQGYGDITWVAGDGTATRELSNGKGLFVQSSPPGGLWTHLDSEDDTPTGRLAEPLRLLGGLQGWAAKDVEDVDDRRARRIVGTLPVTSDSLDLMGLSNDDVEAIGSVPGTVDISAWIDGRGRIIRVDRTVDLPETPIGPVYAHTSTVLDDFSTTIDLDPPSSSLVSEAASSS